RWRALPPVSSRCSRDAIRTSAARGAAILHGSVRAARGGTRIDFARVPSLSARRHRGPGAGGEAIPSLVARRLIQWTEGELAMKTTTVMSFLLVVLAGCAAKKQVMQSTEECIAARDAAQRAA